MDLPFFAPPKFTCQQEAPVTPLHMCCTSLRPPRTSKASASGFQRRAPRSGRVAAAVAAAAAALSLWISLRKPLPKSSDASEHRGVRRRQESDDVDGPCRHGPSALEASANSPEVKAIGVHPFLGKSTLQVRSDVFGRVACTFPQWTPHHCIVHQTCILFMICIDLYI